MKIEFKYYIIMNYKCMIHEPRHKRKSTTGRKKPINNFKNLFIYLLLFRKFKESLINSFKYSFITFNFI